MSAPSTPQRGNRFVSFVRVAGRARGDGDHVGFVRNCVNPALPLLAQGCFPFSLVSYFVSALVISLVNFPLSFLVSSVVSSRATAPVSYFVNSLVRSLARSIASSHASALVTSLANYLEVVLVSSLVHPFRELSCELSYEHCCIIL